MRKCVSIFFCSLALFDAFATTPPGSVIMINTVGTRFNTNSVAIGGGSGPGLNVFGPWHYQLLTAPATVAPVDLSLQSLLTPVWSDTGLSGTNTPLAGRMSNQNTFDNVNFWPPGQSNAFVIVGWSGNLATTWSDLRLELAGASLVPQNGGYIWQGGGLAANDGQPAWLGATTMGFRVAGGFVGQDFIPSMPLFGTVPDAAGTPIMTPTDLWIVAPEPSVTTLAFAGMILLAMRRKSTPGPS
jgi:hypothetical protein